MSTDEGDGWIAQERVEEVGGAKWSGHGSMTGKQTDEVPDIFPSMRDDFQQPTE